MNAPAGKKITTKEEALRALVDEISIPLSYDEKARTRYRSIGEWLDRPASTIHGLGPVISSQGSFALGTVIRPVGDGDAYDVDVVCSLKHGSKSKMSQEELKQAVGVEIHAYAKAQNMSNEPDDARRCWTLEYQDSANFHMDILPGIPARDDFTTQMRGYSPDVGLVQRLSETAIGITDKKHPGYHFRGAEWLISNPKGYAGWFRLRQETVLEEARLRMNAKGRAYASVEDIPSYEVRTPLQDAIKLLKRHRDVMFDGDKHKPISIIITTIAAEAYQGERTISDTLKNILPKMERRIAALGDPAVISNPSYPRENFADKWGEVSEKRRNFEKWVSRARQDFLSYLTVSRFNEFPEPFKAAMTEATIRKVSPKLGLAAAMIAAGTTAAVAEAQKVEAEGNATKPWLDIE
ncbi:hypothetical protein TL5118_01054 [Thalassovita autumnalis]|uniref:Cyclic GMP-AMP synthase n=1 Tax=Thalassovita autumnalis TaxID=2072972 RepID=A0A0P1F9R5_9RHOB|nr:nucleotidyltransferase [Thalassovita autumnalis]CUH64885.1 hypothetical protein TL5118_01054 [Thalassovita autumnalis]CUH71728.1 hypothetical protein TL5120_01518 [Thalassovita autumnalis]